MNLKNMLNWKMLDIKDYIWYDAIYVKILEKAKTTETENRSVIVGDWGEGRLTGDDREATSGSDRSIVQLGYGGVPNEENFMARTSSFNKAVKNQCI